jgi:hypothetical protein
MQDTISQRDRYMRHEITHHEYYGLLVEFLGEDELRRLLPSRAEKLTPPQFGEASGDSTPTVIALGQARTPKQWRELIAEDEHLNNVPLRHWDARHRGVLALVRRTDREALRAITGSGGWSLADSGCTLKTAARRYAETAR